MAVAGNMTPCIRAIARNGSLVIVGSSYADDSVLYSDVLAQNRCQGSLKDAIDALDAGSMISVRSVDNEFLKLSEQFGRRRE